MYEANWKKKSLSKSHLSSSEINNAEERGDTHAIKFVETWAKEASNSRLARREGAG